MHSRWNHATPWKRWNAGICALSLICSVESSGLASEPENPASLPPAVERGLPPPPRVGNDGGSAVVAKIRAEGPVEADRLSFPRADRSERDRHSVERALIAGALGALAGSIALQAWTYATVRSQCIRPIDGGEASSLAVRQCISDRGGLVAAGTLAGILGAGGVGMAAGAGWLRGRRTLRPDQRRGHRVAGGLLVAAGLGGLIVSGLSVHLGPACTDVNCLEGQRALSVAGRGASLTLLAAGGSMLAAAAR